MVKILHKNNFIWLVLFCSSFFCSLSWAADTISFGDVTYKIGTANDERNARRERFKGNNAIKFIYPTGLEGIYCSSPIYEKLLERTNASITGAEIFLFDSREKRVVPTGIYRISYGNVSNQGSTVDGQLLNQSNSMYFYGVDHFSEWVISVLNKIK
jgi:hypothetical protein